MVLFPSYGDITVLTISPRAFFALLTLLAMIAATVLFTYLPSGPKTGLSPVERLQEKLGLSAIPSAMFFFFALLWLCLFLLLTFGLLWLIWEVIWEVSPVIKAEVWDWRFALAKLAALTATLGGVVALPFTLVRINLTRQQTRHAEDVLFNEKINAASASLYATRQITRKSEGPHNQKVWHDVHEDDVVRRNAAINTLESLADERPEFVVRISRTLSAYVRELSRELPPEERPWAQSLQPARSDLHTAVQTIGRLIKRHFEQFSEEKVDLSGSNLQAMRLSARDMSFTRVNFSGSNMQEVRIKEAMLADLSDCHLQAANLIGAKLSRANLTRSTLDGASFQVSQLDNCNFRDARAQDTQFYAARLQGSDFEGIITDSKTSFSESELRGASFCQCDLTDVDITQGQVDQIFGDDKTLVPIHLKRPRWTELDSLSIFEKAAAWREFQAEIGFDPKDPSTW